MDVCRVTLNTQACITDVEQMNGSKRTTHPTSIAQHGHGRPVAIAYHVLPPSHNTTLLCSSPASLILEKASTLTAACLHDNNGPAVQAPGRQPSLTRLSTLSVLQCGMHLPKATLLHIASKRRPENVICCIGHAAHGLHVHKQHHHHSHTKK